MARAGKGVYLIFVNEFSNFFFYSIFYIPYKPPSCFVVSSFVERVIFYQITIDRWRWKPSKKDDETMKRWTLLIDEKDYSFWLVEESVFSRLIGRLFSFPRVRLPFIFFFCFFFLNEVWFFFNRSWSSAFWETIFSLTWNYFCLLFI